MKIFITKILCPCGGYGKIAWASNMNPKELNFHIFVELLSITKKGEIERSLFGFGN
jgi:hypothetical protein